MKLSNKYKLNMDITSCNLLKLFLVSYSLKVSYMKDKPSVYAGENKEELPDEDTSEGRKKMEFIMKLSKLNIQCPAMRTTSFVD